MKIWVKSTALVLLLGCHGPSAVPEAPPLADPALEEIDLQITESIETDQALRTRCQANLADHVKTPTLTDAEYDAALRHCIQMERSNLEEPL